MNYDSLAIGAIAAAAFTLGAAIAAEYNSERDFKLSRSKHEATKLLLKFKLAAQDLSERLLNLDPDGIIYFYVQLYQSGSMIQLNTDYYQLTLLIEALNRTVNLAIDLNKSELYSEVIHLLSNNDIAVSFNDDTARIDRFPVDNILKEINDRFTICIRSISTLHQSEQLNTEIAAPPKTRPANPSSRPPNKPPSRPSPPIPANYTIDWDAFGNCSDNGSED